MCEIGNEEHKTQWHTAFYSCILIRYAKYAGKAEIYSEFQLTQQPLRIDVLVVKKDPGTVFTDDIGKNFRTWNVMEFKSPRDGLSIDDFYKTVAYALLLKLDKKSGSDPASGDITVTLVREGIPTELMRRLSEEFGAVIEKESPGVYTVKGAPCPFPVQIVAYGEMSGETECWLRALSSKADRSTASFMADSAEELLRDDPDNAELRGAIESVLFVFHKENSWIFKEDEDMLRIYTDIMEPALKKARADGIAEGEAKGIINMGRKFRLPDGDIISQLMESIKCSLPEARDMLLRFA